MSRCILGIQANTQATIHPLLRMRVPGPECVSRETDRAKTSATGKVQLIPARGSSHEQYPLAELPVESVFLGIKTWADYVSKHGVGKLDHVGITYSNDGNGKFPNFGSGSDSGLTALARFFAVFRATDQLSTKFGLTMIEMETPRPGPVPDGAGSETVYPVNDSGPYAGIMSFDIEVTAKAGKVTNITYLRAGIDSARWGKIIQDPIHKHLSDSPLFPWPANQGTKLFAELGYSLSKTTNYLYDSAVPIGDIDLKYRGRIEFEGGVIVGSRRMELDCVVRFLIDTATLNTPLGQLKVTASPVGVFGKTFVRYNDGREKPIVGVEGGLKNSITARLGRYELSVSGKLTSSTDPAYQTNLPNGSAPSSIGPNLFPSKHMALKSQPNENYGWIKGHHGLATITFKVHW